MADEMVYVTTKDQMRYSPDNRLTADQFAAMAARLADRYGISSGKALQMVHETQKARQDLLDERAASSGGTAWTNQLEADPATQHAADVAWAEAMAAKMRR